MIWLAILTGILAALVMRLTTRRAKLRASIQKIQADLLEFRLYFDEPALIWQAQLNLLRDNFRLCLQFLPAILILALPMLWLFPKLDALYRDRPLRPGEAAVVTATAPFDLRPQPGIQIETPPIRIPHDNQVAWRIRVQRGGRPSLAPAVINYPRNEAPLPWQATFLLISSAAALIVMAL
jgi:hypothetical protein